MTPICSLPFPLALLLCMVVAMLPANAQAQPAAPKAGNPSLGETETEWQGITLVISDLIRLDNESILVAVRVKAGDDAENPTLIGSAPEIPKGAENNPAALQHVTPKPYSLAGAPLMDAATGKTCKAKQPLPRTPY